MTDPSKGKRRPAPLSVRLSADEWARLRERAGIRPVSTYVKSVVLGCNDPEPRFARRVVKADDRLLAELLAKIGGSSLATNVRVLAHQASVGVLNCDEATTARLARACREVTELRDALMLALGKEPRSEAERAWAFARTFGDAARPEGTRP